MEVGGKVRALVGTRWGFIYKSKKSKKSMCKWFPLNAMNLITLPPGIFWVNNQARNDTAPDTIDEEPVIITE